MHRLYYILHYMGLDCAIDEGLPISTKVSHDTKVLQRRIYAMGENSPKSRSRFQLTYEKPQHARLPKSFFTC